MVPTRLVAVSRCLAAQRIPVEVILRRCGLGEDRIPVYRRYFGLGESRLSPGAGLTGQMLATAAGLEELRGRQHRVRYLLHARTMPVAAPFPVNPLHEARSALGLDHAMAFSVTQHACASGLLGVYLAGQLLASDPDPDALALVLAGEKAFTACAQVIEDTAVMGEDSAAILVGTGAGADQVLGYATHTRGEFYQAPWLPEEQNAAFNDCYADALAEVIIEAMDCAGLRARDIDLILPHNVNRLSWLRVLKHAGLPERGRLFLDNLSGTGHCFCADSFINYETARQQGRLKAGDRYLMTAVGLGATFSAMAFQH
jgi:3-oxoacyl-[acyl-carrier-protein] synthase III